MKTVKKKKSKVNIPAGLIAVIIAIGVVSAIVTISLATREKPHQEIYSFGKEVADGIDVSEHNGSIDWEEVKSNKDFAFIRVGYRAYGNGKVYEDKRAKENLENAQRAGIPFGVYFYTQAVNEREAQKEAAFVYGIIKKYDVTLPVMIDFEYPTDKDGNAVGRMTDAANDALENAKIINAFTSTLTDKGYICGVYASSSVFAHRINMKKLDNNPVIWVADYNKNVTFKVDYDIWQYSETGSCDGVSSKYVDLDYWYQ